MMVSGGAFRDGINADIIRK